MTVTAEAVEAFNEVARAWARCRSLCDHRNPARDDEGQGPICEHEDNQSGMEWCSPDNCPLLVA